MAKRPHVPKFGDWNNKGGNVPYTAVFNKARKGKLKDEVKIMNPNDPEENPETFLVNEKDKVNKELVKIKFPIVAEENGEYPSKLKTIAPRSSHIGNLSHHRCRNDEAELYVCSGKMNIETNISSPIQQGRKQRVSERSEKQNMDSLPKTTSSMGHHRKHSSISDIDMIKRPHIPKFGDWNNKGGNVPYTSVFNMARKGKLKDGVKIMNPNDPEENPEAFRVHGKENLKDGPPVQKFRDWDESNPKSSADFPYKFNKVKKEKMNISEMFSISCFLFRTKQRC